MAYEPKGAPFRYKGVQNVEDCHTSLEVMQKAGLDWEVDKCKMFANMPIRYDSANSGDEDTFYENTVAGPRMLRLCPNAYGIYRTDYNIPLGLVKERYEPVQNIDAFKFFDDAIGKMKQFGKLLVLLALVKESLLVLNFLIIFLLKETL